MSEQEQKVDLGEIPGQRKPSAALAVIVALLMMMSFGIWIATAPKAGSQPSISSVRDEFRRIPAPPLATSRGTVETSKYGYVSVSERFFLPTGSKGLIALYETELKAAGWSSSGVFGSGEWAGQHYCKRNLLASLAVSDRKISAGQEFEFSVGWSSVSERECSPT